jgi:uncharacterized iron-regulated membrane protein
MPTVITVVLCSFARAGVAFAIQSELTYELACACLLQTGLVLALLCRPLRCPVSDPAVAYRHRCHAPARRGLLAGGASLLLIWALDWLLLTRLVGMRTLAVD